MNIIWWWSPGCGLEKEWWMHRRPISKMDESHSGCKFQSMPHQDFVLHSQDPKIFTRLKLQGRCTKHCAKYKNDQLYKLFKFFNSDRFFRTAGKDNNTKKLTLIVMDIIVVSSSSVSMYSMNPLATRSCQPSSGDSWRNISRWLQLEFHGGIQLLILYKLLNF